MSTTSTAVQPQIEEVTTTKYCFSCAEAAIGFDELKRETCGGCEEVVYPLDTVFESQQ